MTLRFGLIGLGHHGRNAVAPAFFQPGVRAELCAVCDVRAEAVAAFNRPVAGRYTDHRHMLAESALDAVYVAAGMDATAPWCSTRPATGRHVRRKADGGDPS